jgi:hypothetical protein
MQAMSTFGECESRGDERTAVANLARRAALGPTCREHRTQVTSPPGDASYREYPYHDDELWIAMTRPRTR